MVNSPHMLGIASIAKLCNTYKALLRKCRRNKKSSNYMEAKVAHFKANYKGSFSEACIMIPTMMTELRGFNDKQKKRKTMSGIHSFRSNSHNIHGDDHDQTSPRSSMDNRNIYKHRSADHCFPIHYMSCGPSPRTSNSHLRSISQKSTNSSMGSPPLLGKNMSRRSSNNIMFSNSSGLLKPPTIEKKLACTLEELCYGCQKKIKITRNVVNHDGILVQEEKFLTIKVKPGWKKGTKITFEGMGNEKPGTNPADITFIIAEKRHKLFRREGDDLELAIEIPLVKALTGCNLSIPLLGGEKMSLSVDDIIYPGFEKIIQGQGMPISRDKAGRRGNLKVAFLVNFPKELTEEQRLDVLSILQDSG